VTRRSYADPLVANQMVRRDGRRTGVPLPAGMVTDFTGMQNFATITMKDATGETVLAHTVKFCPNQYESTRTRPDAPAANPYPLFCSYGNPFLLGNVWGIQAGHGWAFTLPEGFDLPDGTYSTTVEVSRAYRDHFQIPGRAGATVAVTVRTADLGAAGSAASLRAEVADRRAADRDHAHADEGDPGKQVSAYSADLRPASRRPVAVAPAAVPRGPRPDLRSLPAWGIDLIDAEDAGGPAGHQYLAFGATVWNGGTSPLVVDGFRRPGTGLMDAYQYFYDPAGNEVGSTAAGTMEWDARDGHLHWHFTDFAQYRLLNADRTLAVRSGKEAFCLYNSDAVDDTLPNAKWRPSNTDLASSCGLSSAVAVREVLDIGHGDTYHQWLPGQSFDITDVPNGTYYIEVLANPSNLLTELSTANNSSLRQVILSGSGADRQLTVPAVHGLDP
jgi:hypothetical protein